MAVTGTKTVRDMVTFALRKAGIVAVGETVPTDVATVAMEELNFLQKEQLSGVSAWVLSGMSHTLTAAAAQTLDPVRPVRINSVRFKRDGIELPMCALTRDEYDRLPNKATTGTPTQYHYDRQREAARLYVWPVLGTAAGETLEITYLRELEDVASMNDTLDAPAEWWSAVGYQLAVRICETTGTALPPTLVPRAEKLWAEAEAFDSEGSVWLTQEAYQDAQLA